MFLRSYEGFSSDLLFVSSKWVSCVVFDPQNPNILASCSYDQTIKIWDITSGSCLSTLTVDAGYGVRSVSFSPKDNLIAAGCHNGKIHLVDAVAGEVKSSLTGDKQVNCVAFSPDGNTLAAGDGGLRGAGNVRLYDVHTGEVKSTLRGHRYVPFPCMECLVS